MAARKFLTPIDLTLLEIRNAIAHLLASAPGSPVEGQIYYNTTTHTFSFYNGSAWVVLGTLDQITAPAADVSLNSHKITNVTDPTSAQDAATRGYVLAQTVNTLTAPTVDFSMNSHKITNLTTPSTGSDASNKTYVDGQTLNGIATRTASTADITVSGFKITNLGTPSSGTDAVTKTYADALVAGVSSWKTAVRAATTANGTLATAYENGDVIDGVTLATGDRILLKNQTTGGENGIYQVAASGAPTRTTDADAGTELIGAGVFVDEGTTQADSSWINTTNGPITLGTTATVWVQFSGAGQITSGAGLTKTGNTLDVGAGNGITVAADSIAIDTSIVVDKTTAQTLTNKTLTSPVVNTPTGIVKGDVGLGNVLNSVQLVAASNLSDLANAGTARTNLGVAIGSNVQAWDADLDTVAGLTATTDNFIQSKAGAWASRTIAQVKTDLGLTGAGRFAVDVGDGSTTSIVITHNLGTLDVVIQVYVKGTTGALVDCDIQHTTTNTATLVFAVAPTSAQYRAICLA